MFKMLNCCMFMVVDVVYIGVWEWDIVINEFIWDEWMYKIYNVFKVIFIG